MSYVSAAEIQRWIEATKLSVTTVDADLDQAAADVAFSMVGNRYDTTAWVNNLTVPNIVRVAMSMLEAAWVYERSYADQEMNPQSFGTLLESEAMRLLGGIASGSVEIVGQDQDREPWSYPSFWPTDMATSAAGRIPGTFSWDLPDQCGYPNAPNAAPMHFTSGQQL